MAEIPFLENRGWGPSGVHCAPLIQLLPRGKAPLALPLSELPTPYPQRKSQQPGGDGLQEEGTPSPTSSLSGQGRADNEGWGLASPEGTSALTADSEVDPRGIAAADCRVEVPRAAFPGSQTSSEAGLSASVCLMDAVKANYDLRF